MIPREFSEYFRSLNPTVRHEVADELLRMISPDIDNVALLENAKSKSSVSCPKCGCNDVRANGKYREVQQYYSKGCKKYFRDTTGNPVFGLKKPELFPTYLYHCLWDFRLRSVLYKQVFVYRHHLTGDTRY